MSHFSLRSLTAWACTLGCLLAVGCGPSGPVRYDASGHVMFKGEVVPAGEISFRPDTSKGNNGPGSYAMIHEGKWETLPDQGILGGPYLVDILGYDSPPAGEGAEGGTALFYKYTLEYDFPKEDSEGLELTVPASSSL